MKQGTKKNDILLIFAVFLLAGAIWLVLQLTKQAGGEAVITQDGLQIASLPLDRDSQLDIPGLTGGCNTVMVSDGRVCVAGADCPDQTCVRQGWISYAGESIVCLPHRLVITLQGGLTGPDAIAG